MTRISRKNTDEHGTARTGWPSALRAVSDPSSRTRAPKVLSGVRVSRLRSFTCRPQAGTAIPDLVREIRGSPRARVLASVFLSQCSPCGLVGTPWHLGHPGTTPACTLARLAPLAPCTAAYNDLSLPPIHEICVLRRGRRSWPRQCIQFCSVSAGSRSPASASSWPSRRSWACRCSVVSLSGAALPENAVDGAILGVLAGLAGAKLLWVAEHRGEEAFTSLLFSRGGLSWFGGLVGGVGAALVLFRREGLSRSSAPWPRRRRRLPRVTRSAGSGASSSATTMAGRPRCPGAWHFPRSAADDGSRPSDAAVRSGDTRGAVRPASPVAARGRQRPCRTWALSR